LYDLLIVEDEEEIRNGIKSWLESRMDCYRIRTARNGVRALELLEQAPADFILLDMRMPLMDGISFLKELRRRGGSPLVVVLSGFDEFQYAQAALEHGAVRYILKPVTPDEIEGIAREIRTMLDRKTASDAEVEFLKEQLRRNHHVDITGHVADFSFDMNELVMEVRTGLADEVKSRVMRFFDPYRSEGTPPSLERAYVFVSLVNAALASVLEESGISLGEAFGQPASPFREAFGIERAEELEAWLLRIVDAAMERIARKGGGGRKKRVVERIRRIVNEDYREDVTTGYLSQRLLLNKDYLGRIFKEATGFSVSDYVNRVRVGKAKELLKEGRLKVYEIAEAVGYADEHYFSTQFRKIAGTTPSDFR